MEPFNANPIGFGVGLTVTPLQTASHTATENTVKTLMSSGDV